MGGRLGERLQEAGYRLTAPRRAVLDVVERMEGHLSPPEILERGREVHADLGRATVYRTLDLLTELGVLRPIRLGDGSTRFAYVEHGHHHLICLECGAAIPFDDCVAEELGQVLAERLDFQVESHMLEFYGLCKRCR